MRFETRLLPQLAALILGLSTFGVKAQDPAPKPLQKTYRLSHTLALPKDRPLVGLNVVLSTDGDQVMVWGRTGYGHELTDGDIGSIAWRLGDPHALWERFPQPLTPFQAWAFIWGCGGGWCGPRIPPAPGVVWDGRGQSLETTEGVIDLMTCKVIPREVVPEAPYPFFRNTAAALALLEDGSLAVQTPSGGETLMVCPPPTDTSNTGLGDGVDPTGQLGWRSVAMSEDGRRVVATWQAPLIAIDRAAPEVEESESVPILAPPEPLGRPFHLMAFDVNKDKPFLNLTLEGQPESTLFLSPTGTFLVRVDQGVMEAWNLDVGLCLWRRPAPLDIWKVDWEKDEANGLIRNGDTIAAINFRTGEIQWRTPLPEATCAVSQDGLRVLNHHRDATTSMVDAIQVWTLEDDLAPEPRPADLPRR